MTVSIVALLQVCATLFGFAALDNTLSLLATYVTSPFNIHENKCSAQQHAAAIF